MKNLDVNSFEYWEKILEKEGLWDIDVKEWFSEKVKKVLVLKTIKDLDNYILEIEERNNVFFEIDEENFSVILYDRDTKNEIWFVKPWIYSYNWLNKKSHLDFVVSDNYRWKWFWKNLLEIYDFYWKVSKNKNFSLPIKEYHHKLSSINLFIKYFWYKISAKFIDWEKIEVDDYEFDRINFWWKEELDHTYELEKIS